MTIKIVILLGVVSALLVAGLSRFRPNPPAIQSTGMGWRSVDDVQMQTSVGLYHFDGRFERTAPGDGPIDVWLYTLSRGGIYTDIYLVGSETDGYHTEERKSEAR